MDFKVGEIIKHKTNGTIHKIEEIYEDWLANCEVMKITIEDHFYLTKTTHKFFDYEKA